MSNLIKSESLKKQASNYLFYLAIISTLFAMCFGIINSKLPRFAPGLKLPPLELLPEKAISLARELERATQVEFPADFYKSRVLLESILDIKIKSIPPNSKKNALWLPLPTQTGLNYIFEMETRPTEAISKEYKTLIIGIPNQKKLSWDKSETTILPFEQSILPLLKKLPPESFPISSEPSESCHLPGLVFPPGSPEVYCQIGRLNLNADDGLSHFMRLGSQFVPRVGYQYYSMTLFDLDHSGAEVQMPRLYRLKGHSSILGSKKFPSIADRWIFQHSQGFYELNFGLTVPSQTHIQYRIKVPSTGTSRFQSSVGYINGSWEEPYSGMEKSFENPFQLQITISCAEPNSRPNTFMKTFKGDEVHQLRPHPESIRVEVPEKCNGKVVDLDINVQSPQADQKSLVFLSHPVFLNKPETPAKRNLIFITADAMRYDHTSLDTEHPSSYAKNNTPALSQLAKLGVSFDHHFVMRTLTQTSFPIIFSGLAPFSLEENFPVGKSGISPSSKMIDNLPGLLQREGYQTFGSIGSQSFGKFGPGVENFDELLFPDNADDRERLKVATQWLADRDSDRPFFLWVHLRRPHTPYDPDPTYRVNQEFVSHHLAHPFSKEDRIEMLDQPNFEKDVDRLEAIRTLYDGNIRQVDSEISAALKNWEKLGHLENTVISISSDHGESLGEHHRYFQHGTIENASLHVPWIIIDPLKIKPGTRVSHITQAIDFYPTILELLDIKIPSGLLGKVIPLLKQTNFSQLKVSEENSHFKYAFSDLNAQIFTVQDLNWKYVSNQNNYSQVDSYFHLPYTHEKEELYDLKSDYSEEQNVIQKHPEVAAELKEILVYYQRGFSTEATPSSPLNPRALDLLKQAGYFHADIPEEKLTKEKRK